MRSSGSNLDKEYRVGDKFHFLFAELRDKEGDK